MIHLETLDGTRYDLKSIGLYPLSYQVESLAPRHFSEVIEGRPGIVNIETEVEPRMIFVRFGTVAKDKYDYYLLQNEVYKLLDSQEYFYLINENEPKRRWKVKVASGFTPSKLTSNLSEFEVEFIAPFPYAESYGTTLDPFTFDSELWQVGQGVISEDLVYAHATNEFQIYNGSDILIDPRYMDIKIKYQGASDNLTITNTTTGDVWSYNGTSGVNDTILLDGIYSLKNNESIFKNTNKKLITLEKGWNDFTLSGTSGSFLISFEFRFYNI